MIAEKHVFFAKLTLLQMIKDNKFRDGRYAFLPNSLKVALAQNFPNAQLPPLSDLQVFIRLPQFLKFNLQSCGVEFQSVGLDDYERDRKSDRQAWRQEQYCQFVLILNPDRQANYEIKRGSNCP